MQHFLWRNRESLEPYLSLMMLRHMKPVIRQCGIAATTRNPLDLMDIAGLLDTAFSDNPVPEGRNLIMSAEGLCGHLPGRAGVEDYAAAPMLIQYLCGYLADRFPGAQIRVILSTRGAEAWLTSAYCAQLRATRLTATAQEFADRYKAAADFDAVLAEIATLIDPIDVLFLPLEEATRHPLGPGCALLDQIPVPDVVRNALLPVGRGNEGPSAATRDSFLRMNQSTMDDAEVIRLKADLAQAEDLGMWKRL